MPVQLDTTPRWFDVKPPVHRKLDRDLRVDVLVVGGGMAGLSAAYLLTREGRKVAVVERERCAREDTGHTSAHLTMVTDQPLAELVNKFGRDHAQAVWDAGLAAIALIDDTARREEIDCDLARVPGYLHVGRSTNLDATFLEDEARLASDFGFDADVVNDVPLVGGAGVRYGDQARFHPLKYLSGLAKAIVARGGHIFEHSTATEFSSDPRTAKVNGHTVAYGDLVIATHNPLVGNSNSRNAAFFQTKLALYTSYVVAGKVPKGAAPDVLLWGLEDPYHYYRVETHPRHDVVIYGGEDHKTGQTGDEPDRYETLERDLAVLVPGIEITHRWSGQVIVTPDGLPYIGETAPHQHVSTGFCGNGITFGTLAAMMATDRILGVKNPWSDLFAPDRTIVHGVWNYLKENSDYPYYRVRDALAGRAERSLRGIARGTGKVVEHNGQQTAAYRSESGELALCSAICPHMGCLVDWNQAEGTWDCPCHGSRFKTSGAVIAGPAESPLERVKR